MTRDLPTLAAALEAEAERLLELARQVRTLEAGVANGGETGNGEVGRLLSARDVAKRTGLPLARVYALGRQGEAGAVRTGERAIRFSESGLDAWLRSGGVS